MKNLILFLITVIALIGCSTDNAIQPQSVSTADPQHHRRGPLPFYGVYVTETEFPADPGGMIVNKGDGFATHLGKSSIEAIHTFATPEFEGTLEFVSHRSGAKLFADISGLGYPPDENGIVRFDGDADITGGTQRFTNASGQLKINGWIDVTTEGNQGEVRYEGEIHYGYAVAASL